VVVLAIVVRQAIMRFSAKAVENRRDQSGKPRR
jgi:hypothetical protein